MNSERSPKQMRIAAALLVLVTLAVFWPVRENGFVRYDDHHYIIENPQVRGGLTWSGVVWAFTHSHASNWHPLTWISHMVDCSLFGIEAGAHHTVSLMFHAANGALLLIFLQRVTRRFWPSLVVAVLFAVHPLRVESVAWAAERKDVLSSFFGLLAMLAYTHYAASPNRLRYAAMAGLFLLSLLAKPMLVTLPCLFLLFDFWPLARRGVAGNKPEFLPRQLVIEKLPLLGISLLVGLLTVLAQRAEAMASLESISFPARAANAAVSCFRYLGKAVWPVELSPFYPFPAAWPAAAVAGAVVGLVIISVGVLRQLRQRPYLATGWFWYLGMLVPVIGLVQVGLQSMADRYTYLPMVGVFMVMTWGGFELATRWPGLKSALCGVLIAAVLCCVMLTRAQIQHWHDTVSLFEHALKVTPNNPVAHSNLAWAYSRAGQLERAAAHYAELIRLEPTAEAMNNYANVLRRLGETGQALGVLQRAAQLAPDDVEILNNLGLALGESGQVNQAVEHYRRMIQRFPEHVLAHQNLGVWLQQQGLLDEAMASYQMALRLKPDFLEAHAAMAHALERARRWPEARTHFLAALRLQADDPGLHGGLARVLAQEGRVSESISEYRAALQIYPDYAGALTELAWLLATTPEAQYRNGSQALALAGRAWELTGGRRADVLDALAAAQAETGRFDEAVATATRAQALARQSGLVKLAQEIDTRLAGYRERRAFRQNR